MSNEFTLNVEARSDLGKGASRRLRRLENKVPAVLYGTDKTPTSVSLRANELSKALENEAFYSHILTLILDGVEEQVVLKDLQRHPAKGHAVHADFLRIDATHKIHMHVPLHFLNEEACVGVKTQGGKITHLMTDIEVSCYAKDLPEYFEVNMAEIEAGTTLHLSDVTAPEGVEIIELTHGDDHNHPIVTVIAPKGSDEDEDAAEAEVEASE
ncbi:50S ribosomal protein L25/general stress protein Ctc [Gammaproteobacteria bacterium 45_16_T64]|nr:50S ribosomal protein L25/general stress protein Ctc [Gammaproteobacteria bacterium 45_16_T64]